MIILNNTDYKVNPMRNSILFVLAVASLESGCGAKLPSLKPFKMEVQQGNVVTSKMLLQLRPGMTRSQVRYIMGTPLIVDSFRDNRWDYFYELRKQGAIVEKRRVILDFDKDSLVSVRGDVIPSAENPDVKTIAELPQKKVEAEKEQGWTDKLKFWKAEEGAAAEKAAEATATDAAKVQTAASSAPAVQATAEKAVTEEEIVPHIPEGEYQAKAAANEQEMAAKIADTVEPPPVFKEAPVVAPTAAAAPEPVLPPPVKAGSVAAKSVVAPVAAAATVAAAAAVKPAESKQAQVAKSTAVAAVEDDEVIPYIPEGEYVAPVVPTEQEMVKGNMAEANAPATDAEAHQVTEKGVAPKAEHAAEPSPTFVAEQLPEPEPEPELPPPPAKSIVKEVAPVVPPTATLAAKAPQAAAKAVEPAPVVAQEVPAGDDEINQAVAAWAQAWRSKDIKNYLAAYAPDFVPEGLPSKKAWEAQRKQRLSAGQGAITLVLNNIQVQREGTAAIATVHFEQKYAAKSYKDELTKTLEMRYDSSLKRWLITRERVTPLAGAVAVPVADLPKVSASESVVVAEASVAPTATVDSGVESAVQAWAQAWRSKNTNAYFAAYSPAFVPEGLPNRAAWEAQRKKRLSPQQGKISLDISNLNVSRTGDAAVVTFTQKYAAKSYRDEMSKRLELQLDAATQRWLIMRETAASGAEAASGSQQVTAPEGSAEHLDGVLEQIGF